MPVPDRMPVAVPGNRWDLFDVPELGAWEPSLRVSVVIPYYENPDELELTLAGLSQQTYPPELTEVVVVDDGSHIHPAQLPPDLPFEAFVLRQQDLGFGAGRARNYGLREASGEVVIFLDSDMIPQRHHVEAHARWHHCAGRLVTLGFRLHADFSSITADRIAEAVKRDAMSELFEPEEVARPEWIEAHVTRTENLLAPVEDLYLMMSGGNLGVDRQLYLEVGGTDETFTRWGGEDNELAYRLLQAGAVVVPERSATTWHQGEGHVPSEEEVRSLRIQRLKMQALIPQAASRRTVPGRIYERPRLLVHVDPAGYPAEIVAVTVDSILANDFTDLVVGVGPIDDEEDRVWLHENYSGEPRVHLEKDAEELFASSPYSPARLTVTAGTGFSADTLDLVMQHLGNAGYGLIHITLPHGGEGLRLGRLVLTRAENRARALGVGQELIDVEIGRMFGERWLSGASLGMWPVEDPIVDLGRVRMRIRSGSGSALEIEELVQRIEEMQNRRVMLLMNGLGTLIRARSWAEIRQGLGSIKRGLFGRRTQA